MSARQLSIFILLISCAGQLLAARDLTTIADQYDSIVAYDAPDGEVLYFYETRRSDACRSSAPDFGSGAMPFGVGYNYFYDDPVTWTRLVVGSYECADECYRNDCKEFKIVQPYFSGRGRRPLMTCLMLWKGCFSTLEAPVISDDGGANNEVMKFDKFRIYKPNGLHTYFTKNTDSYCQDGDLFSGGIAGHSPEGCASLCLFYATKICAAFAFDATTNVCYLKSVNCSVTSDDDQPAAGLSKVEAERASQNGASKLDFYVRKPWLSDKYDFQDLIRFDQTECTHPLPGATVNFSRPDEPAQICRKEASCVGFQCFQYCKEEHMRSPWECAEWDPDSLEYECTFILADTPCRPGVNNVPGRRAFLFVRHDFNYSRRYIAPEFYHRLRRSTTVQPATTSTRSRRPGREYDVAGVNEGDAKDEGVKLRHVRKAHRVRRLHRLAQRLRNLAGSGNNALLERLRKRLNRLRKALRKAEQSVIIDDNF